MDELNGVIVAAVTPFDARGVFQPAWQADQFAWLQEQGVDGVVVAGTNGEGPSLSADERRAVIDAAARHRGRLKLIAGTGTPSLRETIDLSRYACDVGVDAVLIVPPYYFCDVPPAGLARFYRSLCDGLPAHGRMLFYHIPRVSGVPVTHELIREVRRSHPQQCFGIKDTGGDAGETGRLIETFPDLHVLGGSDHLMAANLRAGVRGQISGLANAFPELFVTMWRAHQNGEPINEIQERITAIQSVVKRYPLHAATKALAALRAGLPSISVKPPLLELEPEQRTLLHREIGDLGLA